MKRLLSILTTLVFLTPVGASAAPTSYEVHNDPDMFLNVGLTGTATTGIDIAAPIRNSVAVTFPTTGGGILKFQQGSREELVYYASATVNATTKVITLAGVIRDICWNTARTIVTCSSGKIFSKGASVRLVDAAQLLNLKANIDRANTFTASGSIAFSGSGSLGLPTFATTAERDKQMGASPGGPSRISCVTGTGTCYTFIAGSWISFGSGSAINASDTVAGKVQAITLDHLRSRTSTGATGALNVLTPRYIAPNGSGSAISGFIPQLNTAGVIAPSLGGTGTGGTAGVASGVILRARGTQPALGIYPTAGKFLGSGDGRSWSAISPSFKVEAVVTAASANVGAGTAAERVLAPTWTGTGIDANTLAVGSTVRLYFAGEQRVDTTSTNLIYRFRVAGQTCFDRLIPTNDGNARYWAAYIDITARSIGASASIYCSGVMTGGAGTAFAENSAIAPITVNSTLQLPISIVTQFGGTDADQYVNVQAGSVSVLSAPN